MLRWFRKILSDWFLVHFHAVCMSRLYYANVRNLNCNIRNWMWFGVNWEVLKINVTMLPAHGCCIRSFVTKCDSVDFINSLYVWIKSVAFFTLSRFEIKQKRTIKNIYWKRSEKQHVRVRWACIIYILYMRCLSLEIPRVVDYNRHVRDCMTESAFLPRHFN